MMTPDTIPGLDPARLEAAVGTVSTAPIALAPEVRP
jgi:hypothetical protein